MKSITSHIAIFTIENLTATVGWILAYSTPPVAEAWWIEKVAEFTPCEITAAV